MLKQAVIYSTQIYRHPMNLTCFALIPKQTYVVSGHYEVIMFSAAFSALLLSSAMLGALSKALHCLRSLVSKAFTGVKKQGCSKLKVST